MAVEISIIICTYNREKFIGECLECLGRQTLDPSRWEAIIIDNNSTDHTAQIVHTFINRNPGLPFRYVFEPIKGLSAARNRGISEASSGLICFIDDDAEAVPGFAKTILEFMLLHPEAAGTGGKVLPKYSETPEPEWMNKYLAGFIGLVDHGQEPRLFAGKMKYPIGCNMTYRKELLLAAGGFNNQLTFRGDDKHIFYAVSKINPVIFYLPAAMVYHNIDASRLSFPNFKKLFLKTGNEEKIRIKAEQKGLSYLLKLGEYVAKFGASLLLWLWFSVRGSEIKGRYVMFSQWFTLRGFLQQDVFVR
jgi:glycosyltransferase involved in cell wall biosynthesis